MNLPPGYSTTEKHGLYAEFGPDGRLRHYGNYSEGQPRGWILHLDGSTGFAERHDRDEFDDDAEVSFEDWVEGWITSIHDKAISKLACSFCGKKQDEVRKLIAGPSVYICNECIELCSEILAEETP